jgi:hypothetical protein
MQRLQQRRRARVQEMENTALLLQAETLGRNYSGERAPARVDAITWFHVSFMSIGALRTAAGAATRMLMLEAVVQYMLLLRSPSARYWSVSLLTMLNQVPHLLCCPVPHTNIVCFVCKGYPGLHWVELH